MDIDKRKQAYRYVDVQYAPPLDEFENPCGTGRLDVVLHSYPIVRTTLRGIWIDVYGQQKFVRLTARKRFACLTLADAQMSFVARKQAQIRIYTARLRAAKTALELGLKLKGE